MDCYRCEGHGEIGCPDCHETHRHDEGGHCPRCSGHGVLHCSTCNGTGLLD